jgi:hypothetical protein
MALNVNLYGAVAAPAVAPLRTNVAAIAYVVPANRRLKITGWAFETEDVTFGRAFLTTTAGGGVAGDFDSLVAAALVATGGRADKKYASPIVLAAGTNLTADVSGGTGGTPATVSIQGFVEGA